MFLNRMHVHGNTLVDCPEGRRVTEGSVFQPGRRTTDRPMARGEVSAVVF